MTLHFDVETRSTVDLKKAGMFRYFEDPSTDIWCASYAIGEGPVKRWLRGQPCPADIREHIESGGTITAHNAGFERQAFIRILGPRYGFPVPALEQFYCTAAAAAAMALPRDLAGVAFALGLDQQKDMTGKRVMMQLSRPRKIESDGTILWWDTHPDGPKKLETLYAYCDQDVLTERAVDKHVRPLSEFERRVWLLDQQINERGVPVDVKSVQHARWILYRHAERLAARLAHLTGGFVTSPGQVARLTAWLRANGVDVEELDKNAVRRALDDLEKGEIREEDIEAEITKAALRLEIQGTVARAGKEALREALLIRQELSKTSTKKLNAFEDRCSSDARARDNLMYAAASTLRWGGRGIQLQNLPRPQTKKFTCDKTGKKLQSQVLSSAEIDFAFSLLPKRDPYVFDHTLGSPSMVVADMLRGMLKAKPGKKFVKGDYSNIEGRVLAWLAGERWKLDAFAKADRKEGPDIYLLTAAKIFGVDPSSLNKESPERQVGKVSELACGFAGSVGAFQTMAGIYDVEVSNSRAKEIVYDWREAHPAIVSYWDALEEAAIQVVTRTGKRDVGACAFAYKSGFMWARKPNGEFLCYVDPRIRQTRRILFEDGSALSQIADKTGRFEDPAADWEIQVPEHEAVTVMSVNSQTRKWSRVGLYGGLLAENLTQAVSRDVMCEGMFRVEAAGYPIVLTVHDEIISEVDSEFGSAKQFEQLMVGPAPAWTAGLPVRAEGDECVRYRK